MPPANVTTATVTKVEYLPGTGNINVQVSIHRRINRQARKKNRAHELKATVTYDSAASTTETVSATVLVSATTLIGRLPDKRREVLMKVPLGGAPEPGAGPNFQTTIELIIAPRPGRERDDDDGDDESIGDDAYDNS